MIDAHITVRLMLSAENFILECSRTPLIVICHIFVLNTRCFVSY